MKDRQLIISFADRLITDSRSHRLEDLSEALLDFAEHSDSGDIAVFLIATKLFKSP